MKLLTGPALAFACVIYAQAPLAFEVASIHPNPGGSERSVIDFENTGRLLATNTTLRSLVQAAYSIQNDQLVGGPKWLDTDRYDIEAKTAGKIIDQQQGPLMQSLLADRFKLKTHRENRELTVYGLEVVKTGPLVKKSQSQSSEIRNNRGPGKTQISVVNISIRQFSAMLGRQLGRIVVDKTGMTGGYDFTLSWDPEGQSETVPSVFAALQEQMGLKLESQKAMIDVLVIDNAEKASEN